MTNEAGSNSSQPDTPDLQWMLPDNLRQRWCVVPRYSLYHLFAVGALFGTGLSLSIIGLLTKNELLTGAVVLSILAAMLQTWLLRNVEKRYEADAKKLTTPK